MNKQKVIDHIVDWLRTYCENAGMKGFIVGISGGVDSALTSTLCALTGKKTILLSMPIWQGEKEYSRATNHILDLKKKFKNVESYDINLTQAFTQIENDLPEDVALDPLAMANTRSRLRMLTLYAVGQTNGCLVAGTGNKVEDFGVGFFTKYGDGGVDLSPIADLLKTDVWSLAKEIGVIQEIIDAPPTDGLWNDGRTDEDHIGASYAELEWAMDFRGDENSLDAHQKRVLGIFRKLNSINQHKMKPIPVCIIPKDLRILLN